MKIKVLTPLHKEYPQALLAIQDPPKTLYVAGKITIKDPKAVAIVGSRTMTKYGQETAWRFSQALAKAGVTIVSGMARGIDTMAHKAALAARGRTIAVLGSGLDVVYPPENKSLFEKIAQRGAVVSQFPLGTKPLGKNFLTRNRLIAALSRAVLVVEGAKKSGTLSTASHAADLGRDVFAIPGRLDSPNSYLPNYLIENGALIATKPEDILDTIR